MKWNKNGDVYTNGKYKIKKTQRAFTSAEQNGRFYKPYSETDAYVYHYYEEGKYCGQEKNLNVAKEKMEKRAEKNK